MLISDWSSDVFSSDLFAIILDDKLLSAPVIREPITGGSGQISGSFTTQEAHDLSLLMRAGALPAPLTVFEQRSVGPDLGADANTAGIPACLAGVVQLGSAWCRESVCQYV